ncbi:MAG: ABC transporter permease [Verrucomicrobiota bacterium]|nr:ABC transporter permease [Verrucomicrobiota bacterium]
MLHDFRFALRQLIKARAFTAAAVIVLALGIGANTAIFSLMNTMLFRPPAYAQPSEIVQVFSQDKKNPKTFRGFSYPTYVDIRDQNSVFSGVLAHNLAMVGIGDRGDTRRTFADLVSSNYFSVLGLMPMQGRAFLPEEEKPGTNGQVAIVSYQYWQKQNLNPALLNSQITINSRSYTVVGILPKGFTGTMQLFAPEVFLPLGVYDTVANDFESDNRTAFGDRAGQQLLVIARLKSGMSAGAAEPALKTLAANLEQAYPVEQKEQTFMTAPVSRFSTSTNPQGDDEVKMMAPMLFGMAGIVLLVACLNLANMLLARGTARRKEIAIRLALGGSRWRIVRQLLIEGFVLALFGGGVGLVLGIWSSDLLVASFGRMMPVDIVWPGGPSTSLFLATLAFCVLGTLAFALGPALKLSKAAVVEDLKEHAGEDRLRRRVKFLPRNPLVVVQIAFSLALLTAAALFIRGAGKAAAVDTGLQTSADYVLEVDASLAGYDQTRSQNLYRSLEEKLAAMPGVEHASIAAIVPFGMVRMDKSVQRAGASPAREEKPATAADGLAFSANWNSVGADYFTTVGLPLLRGRGFDVAETMHQTTARVAIIDEVLAKKLWPEGNALGRQIQYATKDVGRAKNAKKGAGSSEEGRGETNGPIEIVGIVPYSRHSLFEKDPAGAIYVPFAGGFQSNVFFHIKFAPNAGRDPMAATALIRRTVREVDGAIPVLELKSFAQHLDANFELWIVRAGAALFSVFGGLALGLAVVGVYGVKAYSVARRTREIGIRMALGAQRKTVQWMILREGGVMLASGIAIGLLLAAATGRLVSGMLYDVGALDPLAFTLAPIVLALATLLATWLPARRATRISPMAALRTE